ncbi:MAG: ABC transporter permease [Spirochaetota bacterium]|nr:MAG: ABC transporter permease [Spirochaetota bacterium]
MPKKMTISMERVRLAKFQDLLILVAAVLVFCIFAVALRNIGFLTAVNLINILNHTSVISIMAVAYVFVLGAGQIDLSIGVVVGLGSVLSALGLRHFGFIGGVAAGLGIGIIVGLFHGFFVVRLRIPPFLVTIATMSVFEGVSRWITDLQAISIVNDTFSNIFGGLRMFDNKVSILLFWMVGIAIISHLALRKTTWGIKVLSIGSNEEGARFAGINVDRVKYAVFIFSSLAGAFAGMLYSGRMESARYSYGASDLFTVIAAVIIGGNSIFGGKGTVIGAIIGSIILGMINNGLLLWGFGIDQQVVFRGLIILIAVVISAERD